MHLMKVSLGVVVAAVLLSMSTQPVLVGYFVLKRKAE
jgi:hypothetical protein